jgi:hypothetical protein
MLRHLKNLIKGKKSETISDISINTDENTPSYLLNYEYFSLACGRKHRGYFIDPVQGSFIEYQNPKDYIFFSSSEEYSTNVFWGYETDGLIKRKGLLKNINNSKKRTVEPIITNINLGKIIKDLDESGFDHLGGGCDMGIISYSILIYNPIKDEYRRNILKTEGDKDLTSKSSFTSELLSYFIYT